MAELNQQLDAKKVSLALDPDARSWLARKGYDPLYGARPLLRLIQEEIKDVLSDEILFGHLEKGGGVRVGIEDDRLSFDYN